MEGKFASTLEYVKERFYSEYLEGLRGRYFFID
jgi:hypothetical protein